MSSESDSDEEFVPGEPEQVSEEDSADEETDLQFEQEEEHKSRKRKAESQNKNKSRRKSKKVEDKPLEVEDKVEEPLQDPEEEKKRADDLWAMFLDGTDTKPKTKSEESPKNTTVTKTVVPLTKSEVKKDKKPNQESAVSKERKIFEFAGETIVVEDNIIKETIKKDTPAASPSAAAVAAVKPLPGRSSRSSGGLSGMLGQLNKKNQLSTLDKSKFDWETYKKEEGFEDEVQQTNKGKDGYLDKQDFLERADYRQYEIERDLRTTRRSNR